MIASNFGQLIFRCDDALNLEIERGLEVFGKVSEVPPVLPEVPDLDGHQYGKEERVGITSGTIIQKKMQV